MKAMLQWLLMMNRSQASEHTVPEAAAGDCHSSAASGQSCVLPPQQGTQHTVRNALQTRLITAQPGEAAITKLISYPETR